MVDVARSRIGAATYLAPGGSLNDAVAVDKLRELLDQCRAAHELHVVLDFGQVALLNSAALEQLLDAQDQLTRLGGELKVVNANAAATDAMRLTGVSAYVTVVDDPSNAETSVVPPGPRPVPRGRLGELLQILGLVTEEAVSRAIEEQANSGRRLGHVLLDQGALAEADLLKVLSEQFALAFVRLRGGVFDPQTVRLISKETALRLGVAPLFKVRDTLYLATPDPQSVPSFDTVAELTRAKVKPVLACKVEIVETIGEAHDDDASLSEYIGTLDLESELEIVEHKLPDDYTTIDEIAAGSPVINLINGLIQRAVRDGASDIHIEPSRTHSRIRFRIDGILYQVMSPPLEVHPALVSRLKVMANLDIAERRLPQDGRVQVYTGGRTIDLRFSSLPGIFGEKVVLRVLDKAKSVMDLGNLSMSEVNLETFKSLLERSYGLLLATGPTGSGKTTTLYAAISHLNSIEKSIVTIEDPVEYQIDIINQNQIQEKVGLGFAKVLKHVLRQDPDIVMVGEIREKETAEIAVQAALTGHLVLSTLHTNDSAGAITRMLDMGIAPYLLSSALIGVLAQRLVRTICPSCSTSFVAPPGSLSHFGIPDKKKVRLSRGRGCSACYDSGYKGRVPIHELLVCDSDTQQLMISNPTRDALAEHIKARGIKTLLDSGLAQALEGKTTIEEVTRVVNA